MDNVGGKRRLSARDLRKCEAGPSLTLGVLVLRCVSIALMAVALTRSWLSGFISPFPRSPDRACGRRCR